jgi:surface polysaccharide O-acyltransferase-like enzyme
MRRIQSIDAFRFLAIIGVIVIHTTRLKGDELKDAYDYFYVAINQGSRFAVPFFFIISGFFFAKKISVRDTVLPVAEKILKRLGLIWLFFCMVYILPYDLFSVFEYGVAGPVKMVYWNLENIISDPVRLVFEGSKGHLWFLVSLANSVLIATLFLRYWKKNPLLPLIIVSVALYIFGLLAKSYSETPLGIHIDFNTRNGPFFSTIFFVLGYVLSYINFSQKYFAYGFMIMALGYGIHFWEIYYLYSAYGVSPASHDYVVGTVLVGLGGAWMALSGHPLLKITSASRIGKYTLGIYGIHFVFIDLLMHIDKQLSSPAWEIVYVGLVFLLSSGVTLIAAKYDRLKKVLI